MASAYRAADLVVCRAGALTISELSLVVKAAILVPSPNVAEDHQTKNALALVERGAALMVRDSEGKEKLVNAMLELVHDEEKCTQLKNNIKHFGRPNAAELIAEEQRLKEQTPDAAVSKEDVLAEIAPNFDWAIK